MKLDATCVRDILLYLESDPSMVTSDDGVVEVLGTWFQQICENLPQYSPETIYYTLARLEEGGYISLSTQWAGDGLNMCCVNYITYCGHEFLEKNTTGYRVGKDLKHSGKSWKLRTPNDRENCRGRGYGLYQQVNLWGLEPNRLPVSPLPAVATAGRGLY